MIKESSELTKTYKKMEVQPMPAKFASFSPACHIPLFELKLTLHENLLCKHSSLRVFFKSLVTACLVYNFGNL